MRFAGGIGAPRPYRPSNTRTQNTAQLVHVKLVLDCDGTLIWLDERSVTETRALPLRLFFFVCDARNAGRERRTKHNLIAIPVAFASGQLNAVPQEPTRNCHYVAGHLQVVATLVKSIFIHMFYPCATSKNITINNILANTFANHHSANAGLTESWKACLSSQNNPPQPRGLKKP